MCHSLHFYINTKSHVKVNHTRSQPSFVTHKNCHLLSSWKSSLVVNVFLCTWITGQESNGRKSPHGNGRCLWSIFLHSSLILYLLAHFSLSTRGRSRISLALGQIFNQVSIIFLLWKIKSSVFFVVIVKMQTLIFNNKSRIWLIRPWWILTFSNWYMILSFRKLFHL